MHMFHLKSLQPPGSTWLRGEWRERGSLGTLNGERTLKVAEGPLRTSGGRGSPEARLYRGPAYVVDKVEQDFIIHHRPISLKSGHSGLGVINTHSPPLVEDTTGSLMRWKERHTHWTDLLS